jgi:hypothetical protein
MYLERKRTVRERLQGIPTMQIACSGDRDGSGRSILSNHELASTNKQFINARWLSQKGNYR